jgi:hypothetical protein
MFAITWNHMWYGMWSNWPILFKADCLPSTKLVQALFLATQRPSTNSFLGMGVIFGVNSRAYNLRRLFAVWFQVWFFHILSLFFGSGTVDFADIRLWDLFRGIASAENWYVQLYIFFALLTPGINRCILAIRRSHFRIAVLTIMLFKISAHRELPGFYWHRDLGAIRGYSIGHMLSMYVTMGYFAIHGNPLPRSVTVCLYYLLHWFYMNVDYGVWGQPWVLEKVLHIPACLLWISKPILQIGHRTPFAMIFAVVEILVFRSIQGVGAALGDGVLFMSKRTFAVLLLHVGRIGSLGWQRYFHPRGLWGRSWEQLLESFRVGISVFLGGSFLDVYREWAEYIPISAKGVLHGCVAVTGKVVELLKREGPGYSV